MSLTISLSASGTLIAEIPGAATHSVEVPFSLSGLTALRSILEAQAREPHQTIGFNPAPTQAMVNAFLATHRCDPVAPAKTAAQIAAAEARRQARDNLFADLDLSLDL